MKNISTLILLGLIAVVGVFTLDVYLPGIPAMADQFDVSISQICRTFTAFSIMFAVSQLFYGALSDYIGRKPVLVTGLFISAVATVICIYAKSYESLFLARILQASGIAVFVVLNAIIRDLYTGATAVQVRTFVNTMSGVSISIAPTIGGLLLNRFNWQGGFIASLVLILATLTYALLFYSESNQNRFQNKPTLTKLAKTYFNLFSNMHYSIYVLMCTLAYTVHFSFILMSAKMFINLLGFTPLAFGYLMFIYGGVYFSSGLITTYLSKKISISNLIKLGGACIGLGGVSMFVFSLNTSMHTVGVLLPMAFMTLGITAARAAAITGALAPIPEQAGQGSAGLNLIQFMFSAMIATIISELGNQPDLSLAFLAVACSALIIALVNFQVRMSISKKLVQAN